MPYIFSLHLQNYKCLIFSAYIYKITNALYFQLTFTKLQMPYIFRLHCLVTLYILIYFHLYDTFNFELSSDIYSQANL